MNNISIDKCLEDVPNRFELVLALSHRAHELESGVASFIETKEEKKTIISLMEMTEGFLNPKEIAESIVDKCCMRMLAASSPETKRPNSDNLFKIMQEEDKGFTTTMSALGEELFGKSVSKSEPEAVVEEDNLEEDLEEDLEGESLVARSFEVADDSTEFADGVFDDDVDPEE